MSEERPPDARPPSYSSPSSSDRKRRRRHSSPAMAMTARPSDDDDDDDDGRGLRTLFGHPHGALPRGNVHLASSAVDVSVRDRGLGPALRVLDDESLLCVLSYVDGITLAGGVVVASRFLYVMGHHEELWRDLALREWGECGISVPPPLPRFPPDCDDDNDVNDDDDVRARNNDLGGCWRDVYVHNHIRNRTDSTTTSSSIHSKGDDVAGQQRRTRYRHVPIRMSGIYSDVLFRSWLCRSFALRPSWMSTHTVPTLSREDVTVEIFLTEYETKNVPLLIEGASRDWGALKRWDEGYLRRVAGNVKFRATSGAAPLPARFALDDYLNYCHRATEEAPLYLFDRTFGTGCPRLLRDFDDDLGRTCPWWDRNASFGHDLFGVLGESRRPDYQWLIVGPKRSGSSFHIDPNCTHAWNAPIIGRKRWIFYPPGVNPPGVFPSPNGDDVCMPISIGEWFLTYWDEHVGRRNDPDPSRRPMECTARPGDVLFVPHGWWHMVLNIGDDVDDDIDDVGDDCVGDHRGASVALTRNYVSASNLPDVLRFLDTRVGQISGCRDRRGEGAVAPEDMGREFRRALMAEEEEEGGEQEEEWKLEREREREQEQDLDNDEKKCSDERLDYKTQRRKGKWADLLEKSEARAKEGWGCGAWRDLPQPTCSRGNTELNGGVNAMMTVEDRRSSSTTVRSSILARAKRPVFTLDAGDTIGDGAGAVSPSSASEGFSFGFAIL